MQQQNNSPTVGNNHIWSVNNMHAAGARGPETAAWPGWACLLRPAAEKHWSQMTGTPCR
jgi:hypothetical protein